MAMRNLLHQSKLDAFKDWLAEEGWTICDVKGFYEVLRAKKNGKFLIVYRKLDAKEHYSVMDADCHIVRQFLTSKPQKKEQKKEKETTNANRIRAMSDQELAKFLCDLIGDCSQYCPGYELCNGREGKANGLRKWLQQPVKED